MNIFEDVVARPLLTEEEFEREKTLQLEEIRTSDDNPAFGVQKLFFKTLYPHHPYGRPLLGTTATIQSLKFDQIRKNYRDLFVSSGSVVAAVGDIDVKSLKERLQNIFDQLPGQIPNAKAIKSDPRPSSPRLATLERANSNQAHILLGFQGTTFLDSERFGLKIISSLLSGQGGRLFLDLRDRQSLAYSVTSFESEGIEPGFFGIYVGCAPEKSAIAIKEIRKHLGMLQNELVSEEEINRAKNFLWGQRVVDVQHHSTRCFSLALDPLYGIPAKDSLDWRPKLDNVDAKLLQKLAQKYFDPNSEVLAVVGPKSCFPQ